MNELKFISTANSEILFSKRECVFAGFSLRLQRGEPPAAGPAAAEGGLPERGDRPGQHPQTAELPA